MKREKKKATGNYLLTCIQLVWYNSSSTFYLLLQNKTKTTHIHIEKTRTAKRNEIYFIENMELSADVSVNRTVPFSASGESWMRACVCVCFCLSM